MPGKTLTLLQTVANALGTSVNKAIFIGGSVLHAYITDPLAPENRPTEDVDCLINASGKGLFYLLAEELKRNGFAPSQVVEGMPTCYWTYGNIQVHLLSLFPDMTGFENRWFEEGMFHATSYKLPSETRIRIFTPVYFVASKLEALFHRGWQDLRYSEDFEDLMYLVAYRPELMTEIPAAFHEVRSYIQKRLQALLTHPDLYEGLHYALSFDAHVVQASQVIAKLEKLAYPEAAPTRLVYSF